MPITLTVVRGPQIPRPFTFDGHDTFLVGRSATAHFSLPNDPYFSRVHFLIEANGTLCRLTDLDSHNGTLVNGQKTKNVELRDGDEIECGQTVIKVGIREEAEGATMDLPAGAPRGTPLPADPPADPPPARHQIGFVSLPPPQGDDDPFALPGERGPAPPPPANPLPRYEPAAESQTRTKQVGGSQPRPASPPPPGRHVLGAPVRSEMPEIPAHRRGNLAPPRTVSVQPGAAPGQEPPPPIPGYHDLVQIGEGGMGVVYRARSDDDGSEVAIKAIRPALAPNQKTVGRFLREARVMEKLVHPHIVRFKQMGDLPGMLYFVMEFVPGIDASKLMKQQGGVLPVQQVVGVAVQMMEALGFAHGKGFVHRDIKPANLLLKPTDPGEQAKFPCGYVVKVADFGLARTYEASAMSGLTMSGAAGGTPHFMPPEQVTDFKSVKPPADQYAAAVSVYYLLSGKYPYDASGTAELLKKILTGKPTPLTQHRSDLPRGLAEAIQKAMMTDPNARHRDMFEFAAALRRAAGV